MYGKKLEMVVPFGLVPCQYQETPNGGTPLVVIVAVVHCWDTIGAIGVEGDGNTEMEMEELLELQHPLAL